jgi:hypothetical protein
MTKTRNKIKKNKSIKSSNGGTDLNQKYSLASIDDDNGLGLHTNIAIGILGIGTLLYYTFFKQNIN